MKFFTPNQIKYGLLMCLVILVCLLSMEITGKNQSFEMSPQIMLATILAPAVVWYLGISSKKKILKDKMTYKRGLIEGVRISLVYALISPFIFWFYYMVNPDLVSHVRFTYGMQGSSNAEVILADMLLQVISATIFGTIYSAVIAWFVVKFQK